MRICLFITAFLFLSAGAFAQENYYNAEEEFVPAVEAPELPAAEEPPPPARSVVVTSVQKCYAQLSREEALEIQKNFVKPYQECQKRLAAKLKKKQEKKVSGDKDVKEDRGGKEDKDDKDDKKEATKKED